MGISTDQINIQFNAVMNIDDIRGNMNQIQSVINKLKLPEGLRNSFLTLFSQYEKEAKKATDIMAEGFSKKGNTQKFETSMSKINEIIRSISTNMGKIKPDAFKEMSGIDFKEIENLETRISSLNKAMQDLPKQNGLKEITKSIEEIGTVSKSKQFGNFLEAFKIGDIKSSNDALEALRANANRFTEGSPQLAQYNAVVELLSGKLKELAAAQTETQTKINNTNNSLQEQLQPLMQLFNAFQNNKISIEEFRQAVAQYGSQIAGAGRNTEIFNQEMDRIQYRIKYFFSLTNAAMLFRRAINQAKQEVASLDKVMTETAVVTKFNVGDMWDQLPQYTKNANALGVSIEDAYKATTLFYQQGLNTNQAMTLSNETMKMARIAGLDAAEATNRMTGALRGFNMELNEESAQKVNDIYSKLAAITASNVDEISTAMGKTASIAYSAGMSIEVTSAFLSQIIETTRESAETAGTAMKTVIARFEELKKSPSEIGEVDGEIVDANKIEGALRSIGIALRDSQGQFRNLDDVFLELSAKWNTLDKNTQRYIATIAAGSRQQSRFIAMMQNNERTTELVSAAYNSAGTASEQFSKTQESLESKTAKLKNAWTQFLLSIANSEVIKGVVDVLTLLLNTVNGVISAFSGGNGIVKSFLGILAALGALNIGKSIITLIEAPLLKFISELPIVGKLMGENIKKGYQQAMSTPPTLGDTTQKSMNSNQQAAPNVDPEDPNFIPGRMPAQKKQKGAISAWGNTKKKGYAAFRTIPAAMFGKTPQKLARKNILKATAGMDSDFDKKTIPKNVYNAAYNYRAAIRDRNPDAEREAAERLEKLEVVAKGTSEQLDKTTINTQELANGMRQVGQDALIAGGLLNMFAGWLENAGPTGQVFAKILKSVGLGLMALGAILPLVGTAIQTFATEATIAIDSIPIIGWIAAIVSLLITLASLLVSFWKGNERSPKNLKEAIEKTNEAIDAANQELDDLFSARDGYYELRSQLEGLTQGTTEFTQALQKSNVQVLDLIEKYPELQNYLSTGVFGELTIKEEGWDKVIDNAQKRIGTEMSKQQYNYIVKSTEEIKKLNKNKLLYLEDGETKVNERQKVKLANEYEQLYSQRLSYVNDSLSEEIKADKEFKDTSRAILSLTGIGSNNLDTKAWNIVNSSVKSNDFAEMVERYGGNRSELVGNTDAKLKYAYKVMTGKDPGDLSWDDMKQEMKKVEIKYQSGEKIENLFQNIKDNNNEQWNKLLKGEFDTDQLQSIQQKISAKDELGYRLEIATLLGYDSIQALEDFSTSMNISWNDLTNTITDQYVSYIKKTEQIDEQATKIKKTLNNTNFEDIIANLSQSAQQNLQNTIETIINNQGESTANNYVNLLNDFMSGMSDELKEQFLSTIGTINIESIDDLNSLQNILSNMPDLNKSNKEIKDFIDKLNEMGDAFKHLDSAQMKAYTQSIIAIIDKMQKGERTYSEEEYKNLIETQKFQSSDFIITNDGNYIYVGSTQKAPDLLKETIQTTAEKNKDQIQEDIDFREAITDIDIDYLTTAFEEEYAFDVKNNAEIDAESLLKTLQETDEKTGEWKGIGFFSRIREAIGADEFRKRFGFEYSKENVESLTKEQLAEAASLIYNQKDIKVSDLQSQIAQTNTETAQLLENIKTIPELMQDLSTSTNTASGAILYQANNLNIETEAVENLRKARNDGDIEAQKTYGRQVLMQIQTEQITQAFDENADSVESAVEEYKEADTQFKKTKAIKDLGKALKTAFGYDLPESVYTSVKAINLFEKTLNGGINEIDDYLDFIDNQALGKIIEDFGIAENKVYDLQNAIINLDPDQDGNVDISALLSLNINPDSLRQILTAAGYTDIVINGTQGSAVNNRFNMFRNSSITANENDAEKWTQEYDWLYNVLKKIDGLLLQKTRLEKESARTLTQGNASIKSYTENLEKQLELLVQQRDTYEFLAKKRREEISNIMSANKGYQKYAWFDEESGQVLINQPALEKMRNKISADEGEKINTYIEKLNQAATDFNEATDNFEDSIDQIEEQLNAGKDQYLQLESDLISALETLRQKEIDALSQINDNITKGNSDLLSKVSEGVNEYRDQRKKDKELEDIRKNEQKLAMLRSDTSGASALDILKLDKSLTEQRQNYTDSLIDKQIQEMTKQNEEASKQRQYQIELMTESLKADKENGVLASEVNKLLVEAQLTGSGAAIQAILSKAQDTTSLGNQNAKQWIKDFNDNFIQAMSWANLKDNDAIKSKIVNPGSISGDTYNYVYQIEQSTGNSVGNISDPLVNALLDSVHVYRYYSMSGTKGSGSEVSRNEFSDAEIRALIDNMDPNDTIAIGDLEAMRTSSDNGDYWITFGKPQFATGGLSTQTGPAWLDGTKARPEYVLNATQTQAWLKLVDVITDKDFDKTNNGNVYYNIEVQVDELSNDYDVDDLVERVKDKIVTASQYRNINTINLGRR